MKNNKGFTLVELLVVVAIFTMLFAWGIPAYSRWKGKHDVEADLAKLFNQLQYARMTAYTTKTITGVHWGNGDDGFTGCTVRIDSDNNGTVNNDTAATSQLSSVTTKNTVTPTSDINSVSFDGRGFLHSGGLTLRINVATGARVDCVAVADTRIIIGRWKSGSCTPQ